MDKHIAIVLAAAFLVAMPSLADEKDKPANRDRTVTTERAGADTDVTYGRIKQWNPGQKIVVDIDNAVDKSFDLTDEEQQVNLAADLKVGDPVKITEREVNGKKTVQIVKDTGENVRHNPDRNTRADRVEKDADVTYGRIKEFKEGRIVIDVDNAIDKSFELGEPDRRVSVAGGLKVGDPVKVTEREVNGKKMVQIVKHTGGGVRHGDPDHNK